MRLKTGRFAPRFQRDTGALDLKMMKTVATVTVIAAALVVLAQAEDTNRQSRVQSHIQDEILYRDELRKMDLHKYADMGLSGRGPSIAKQASEAIRF